MPGSDHYFERRKFIKILISSKSIEKKGGERHINQNPSRELKRGWSMVCGLCWGLR
jgi:hypothetical protein